MSATDPQYDDYEIEDNSTQNSQPPDQNAATKQPVESSADTIPNECVQWAEEEIAANSGVTVNGEDEDHDSEEYEDDETYTAEVDEAYEKFLQTVQQARKTRSEENSTNIENDDDTLREMEECELVWLEDERRLRMYQLAPDDFYPGNFDPSQIDPNSYDELQIDSNNFDPSQYNSSANSNLYQSNINQVFLPTMSLALNPDAQEFIPNFTENK